MKTFKVNVKVPIQVTWEPELIEDSSNFYMRLIAGAPRLRRVSDGNVSRYMTLKHFNYNQNALEEIKKKAVQIAKEDPDIKKAAIAGAKGKTVTTPTRPVNTRTSVLDTIDVSEEDKALGAGVGREQNIETRSTRWTQKQLEEITKEE